MSKNPLPPADFTPDMGDYHTLRPFRHWCQKVLPAVYDDSLSYYELLCKVVDFLNKTMADMEVLHGDVDAIRDAYDQLQGYVNTYFENLDVQEEINDKLDQMFASGVLTPYFAPYVNQYVSEWLASNITPTTPALDKTLTINGAAAEAHYTGHRMQKNAFLAMLGEPDVYAAINRSLVIPGYRVQGVTWNNGTFYVCGGSIAENGTGFIATMSDLDFKDLQVTEIPQLGHANDITYSAMDGYLYVCAVRDGDAPANGIWKINPNDFTDKTLISNAPENTIGIQYRWGDYWILAPYRIYATTDFQTYDIIVENTNDLLTQYDVPTTGRMSQSLVRTPDHIIGWVASFVYNGVHYGAITYFSATGVPIAFDMFPTFGAEMEGACYANLSLWSVCDGSMVTVLRADVLHDAFVQLKAGDDLDDFTGRGTLYSTGANVSGQLAHAPVGNEGFTMKVERQGMYNTRQDVWTNSGRVFYRIKSFNTGVWGDWIEPASVFEGMFGDVSDEVTQVIDSDVLTSSASFSSIKQVFDGDTSVAVKYYGMMRRGTATGGVVSDSETRCYCKMPLTTDADRVYFDDTSYNINVAWFRNGAYVSESGWVTSSPYTYTAQLGCDFAYVTVKSANDSDVVDTEDASKTTYFQRTYNKEKVLSAVYVSANGNDSNAGDVNNPLATVDRALDLGAERVFLIPGVYTQQIDLSKSKTGRVELLKAGNTGRVVFRPSNINVTNTESKLEGRTKVYTAPITLTLADDNMWLFQLDTPDLTTLIDNAERMPQQRGYVCRMQHAIIKKCSSATLSDALDEIDNSDGYLWYVDSGTIYFSRQAEVNETNPIVMSDGSVLFLNGTNKNTVIMTGISVEFRGININNTRNSVLTDCSATCVYARSAFAYLNALNVTFIRCEAGGVCQGTNGDGFQAFGSPDSTLLPYKATGRLISCWGHDNRRFGFSDHENSESEIYDGLFEYNDTGVGPLLGSHCVCNGTYSRKNNYGFYYSGTTPASEGGVNGQLECINCVAEYNNAGFRLQSSGNKMILISCKSINNNTGFSSTTGTVINLIDCGSYGNTTIKQISGTQNIIKTTIVEP